MLFHVGATKQICSSYQLIPLGAPPLSVVKTMTELSYNPFLLRALVMLPTDSSNETTIAAYILLSSDEKLGSF